MQNLSPPNDGPPLDYCFACGEEDIRTTKRNVFQGLVKQKIKQNNCYTT